MEVNPAKEKKLTNVRSVQADEKVINSFASKTEKQDGIVDTLTRLSCPFLLTSSFPHLSDLPVGSPAPESRRGHRLRGSG